MQKWKTTLYNASFALNCFLVFLLVFEGRLSVPPLLQSFGRMHPLLLHFPIVLVLLCIGWEFISGMKKPVPKEQSEVGDWLLLLASVTAVISALMGLFLSREDGYTQDIVAWHKWGGIFVSLLALAWYSYRNYIRNHKLVFTVTASAGLVVVIITGHLGANITHGENFVLAPITKEATTPNVLLEDAFVYANMVQPILKMKCMSCHNDSKAKGELVMDPAAALLKGGKNGVLWDSTQPDLGLMLSRIHLPLDNKKHMPPSGKNQLTPDEISIIYHWIKMGSSFTAKVADLPENDTLRIIAASIFNTIETDNYTFNPADENKVKALSNNYRLVTPLAHESPALRVEFFGTAQFKPEQLKELLPIKEQIVSLNLNKMPVTDAELSTIAQFSNLRILNLSFTDIKGDGLSALAPLKELMQLSLSGTGVSVENLKALVSFTKLTKLFIWSTPAQEQDLLAIRQQLKKTSFETGFVGDSIIIKLNPPQIENEDQVIQQPESLKLKHFIKGVTIRFTTDGSDPDSLHSPIYKDDFIINKGMTIKAKAYKHNWISSEISERTFYKTGYKIDSIRLLQPSPDAPYSTMSASILADVQKGDLKPKSGKWIGFRGIPMQAMLYFDTAHSISHVTVSSLIDIRGYIMPPRLIEIWAGNSPNHLRLLDKISPEQPTKEASAYMKGYELKFKPVKEKYIKLVVTPVGTLPLWHRGKGDKGWIFVDEIFLD